MHVAEYLSNGAAKAKSHIFYYHLARLFFCSPHWTGTSTFTSTTCVTKRCAKKNSMRLASVPMHPIIFWSQSNSWSSSSRLVTLALTENIQLSLRLRQSQMQVLRTVIRECLQSTTLSALRKVPADWMLTISPHNRE